MKVQGKMQRRKAISGMLFIAPAVMGTLAFFLVPFFISVCYSFTNGIASKQFVGLANYHDLIGNKTFQMAVGNTARFVAVVIPLLNAVALTLALLLTRLQRKIKDLLRSVYIFPLVLPVASVVLFLRSFFTSRGSSIHSCSFFMWVPLILCTRNMPFWRLSLFMSGKTAVIM